MQLLHAQPWPLLLGPPGAAALRPGSGRPSSPLFTGFSAPARRRPGPVARLVDTSSQSSHVSVA